MSRPRRPERTRPLCIRIVPGSALDRLTSGPLTNQRGLTLRVHDIAERYEELLQQDSGRAIAEARWVEEDEAREAAALPPRNPRSRAPPAL